jgi:HlyD family secretion protein
MMKRTLVIVSLVGVAAAASIAVLATRGTPKVSYRTAAVTRGDLVQTVSATGTLGAVRSVSVGTQVSGQIAKLYADFNDTVRAGQLIAELDPTLLRQAVTQSQADLERAQADVTQKRYLKSQADSLHAHGFVTDADWHAAEFNLTASQTSLVSARAALQRAQQNLGYTSIKAPISGVVIERNVDVGQTVAASLSAPQLFLIAEDLRQMQILVNVDESDIGQIHENQPAHFTVQTYGSRIFTGAVRQVRLQSKTEQNVVNYAVVVNVANPDGALLPGMTATVDFEVGKASDVFTAPNAALRFRPPADVIAAAQSGGRRDSGTAGRTPPTDSARAARRAGGGAGSRDTTGRAAGRSGMAQIWTLDADGKPVPMRVRTGITDGQRTEISGADVRDGLQVIIGTITADQAAAARSTTSANPFQPATPNRGPGGRGF